MTALPDDRCTEEVWEAPGYWYSHPCTRRAKWLVQIPEHVPRAVCTQHRKWFDRWGEVLGPVEAVFRD